MDWRERYRDRIVSMEEAVTHIRSGDTVTANFGASIPYAFLDALADYAPGHLEGVTLMLAGFYKETRIAEPACNAHVAVKSSFFGPWERRMQASGSDVSYQVMHLSNISFDRMGKHVPRVVLAAGSVPDENGLISLGVAPFDLRLLDVCEELIIQINPRMPFILGEKCTVPAERASCLVFAEEALPEMQLPVPTEEQRRIAAFIAERIPDGACVQFGIGGISAAIGEGLMERRELSCYSEMFTEPVMKLMQAGVITNSRSKLFPGKTVFTNALGSAAMYAYMDRNPCLEALPTAWLNDPRNIAQNDSMISINGAFCTDLTGQVSAESIGFRQFSGTGGQLDYVRGARWSRGGKSFLAFPSTHTEKDGTRVSNIALTLPEGSVVTTPRADTHFIVTEYGAADLQDEPVDVRVRRLIAIAHPDFRDRLLYDARRVGYLI